MATDTYDIRMHPELPIMMTRFNDDFVFTRDAGTYSAEVKACLDAQNSPVYYVFDLTHWHMMSFDELINAAAQAARGKETNFHHPMNRMTLIITNDKAVEMSAAGMTSAAYYHANIKVFHSMEEAMQYAQQDMVANPR